ncbi:MAG: DsbA family protein [Erythrobacter sp.]|nr:DsbA family protein [Erythrobacter sp.]
MDTSPPPAPTPAEPPSALRHTLLTALLALVFGFLGAATWSYAGLADNRTRAFLMTNPDVLPQMAQAYQEQEAGKRLAEMGDEVFTAFPGAVIGNPNGKRVLVEFTDYNCTFCEASVKDVNRLVAEDPDLKVVIREWPIFEGSDVTARMALAAAMQGKYAVFHEAMFKTDDVNAAAQIAGLDMARAQADAASQAVSTEIARNLEYAQALGFTGTPAWVAGDTPMGGMVGYDKLKAELAGDVAG